MASSSTIETIGALTVIRPGWNLPPGVQAFTTTRHGGVSAGPWQSLNLAAHVEDDPVAVEENRRRLRRALAMPAEPVWLEQVHGAGVSLPDDPLACADAVFDDRPGRICAVQTADCLPVLFCDDDGRQLAAAHAGWRGLLAGVLEQTAACFAGEAGQVQAWLGPAIGPDAFEVGDEVRAAFVAEDEAATACFQRGRRKNRWLANLYALARIRLARAGIERVAGGEYCTLADPGLFFSFRRDGETGRMATLIWRET